jgi:hypothetical protein
MRHYPLLASLTLPIVTLNIGSLYTKMIFSLSLTISHIRYIVLVIAILLAQLLFFTPHQLRILYFN